MPVERKRSATASGSWVVEGIDESGETRRFEVKKSAVVDKLLELDAGGYKQLNVFKPVQFSLTTSAVIYDDDSE